MKYIFITFYSLCVLFQISGFILISDSEQNFRENSSTKISKLTNSYKSDGNIYISNSNERLNSYSFESLEYNILGAIRNVKKSANRAYGNLIIGEQIISPNRPSNDYSELLMAKFAGKLVIIKLLDSTNSTEEFREELYFPLPFVHFQISVPDSIQVGSTIKWNYDPNNKKGVLVLLKGNINPTEKLIKSKLQKEIFIPNDAGSYTFTKKDLEGFNGFPSLKNGFELVLFRENLKTIRHLSNHRIKTNIKFNTASNYYFGKTY